MRRLVVLPGHGKFWFLAINGTGPLVSLDHCDDEGNLKIVFPPPQSYAHVCADGAIKRFRKVIGHKRDLIDQPKTRTVS